MRAASPRHRSEVLVVEDEALILFDICANLADAGFDIVGEAVSLDEAFAILANTSPDVAVLDINVGKQTVWPLARTLAQRGTQLVFVSANLEHEELRTEFAQARTMEKPVYGPELANIVAQAARHTAH